MFYVKNVPGWERVLRVVTGLIVAVSAAGIAASGLFGFCPTSAATRSATA
jgi:hypothetical protein